MTSTFALPFYGDVMDGGLAPHAAVGGRQASQERLPCSLTPGYYHGLALWQNVKKVAQLAKHNLESLIWASRSHYLLGLGDFVVAIFSVGFRG